jgi:hypothetical protein
MGETKKKSVKNVDAEISKWKMLETQRNWDQIESHCGY